VTRIVISAIAFCQIKILRDEVLAKCSDRRFNGEQRRMTNYELVDFPLESGTCPSP